MLSPVTSTLPEITGNSAVSMNFASGSGPPSNSWLPKTMASGPMRFKNLGLGLTVVGGEEKRALEVVPGVEHHDVLAGRLELVAQHVDRGVEPGGTAEAFAGGLVLRRTGGIEAVNRLDAAVEVVEVQDVQCEGGGRLRQNAERRGGEQEVTEGHGRVPCVRTDRDLPPHHDKPKTARASPVDHAARPRIGCWATPRNPPRPL